MVEAEAESAKMEYSAAGRGNERRKSWLKDLIKRWRSRTSKRAAASEPSNLRSTTADRQADPLKSDTTEAISTADEPSGPSKAVEMTADKPADFQPLAGNDTTLVTDDGDLIPADDNIETLLPMVSLSQERAQKIFEKYGLKYEPRNATTNSESKDTPQRVEKSIRIRIHWTCHECNAGYGSNKTCTTCGHRRCRQCSRSPPKKVKDLAKKSKEQDEQDEEVPSAVPGTVVGVENTDNATSKTVSNITSAPPESEHQRVVTPEDDVAVTQHHQVSDYTRILYFLYKNPKWWPPFSAFSENHGNGYGGHVTNARQCSSTETTHVVAVAMSDAKPALDLPRPKRIPQPPDPVVLQSVNDKLAQLHIRPPTATPSVVAAAG
ncbi:hypothetical protein LTR37_008916 [Vermiconidia calcicola]|uniref:Uncharacterized protein n=1 Tax=Vermiconidia calcicola TaxID=1690605 RepID=A0ACC3NC79_9PEZI|nr:hypothetical protein LTR37_008916 [Vermiconidia calcicola]